MLGNTGPSPPAACLPPSPFPWAQRSATKPVYRRVFMWWISCIHTGPACFIRGPSGSHLEFISSPLKFERDNPHPTPQALSKYTSQPELCTQTAAVLYTQKSSVRVNALRGITSGCGVTNLVWTSHILISWPQQVTALLVADSFVCGSKCRPWSYSAKPNILYPEGKTQCSQSVCQCGVGSQSKNLMGFLERFIQLIVFFWGCFWCTWFSFQICIISKRGFPHWWRVSHSKASSDVSNIAWLSYCRQSIVWLLNALECLAVTQGLWCSG